MSTARNDHDAHPRHIADNPSFRPTPLVSLSAVAKDVRIGEKSLRLLSDIDLSLSAGEFVSITGPSGSGKTTLMNILGLLDRATAGVHRFAEQDVGALTPNDLAALRRTHIGFVFQAYHLIPHRTVMANVEMPLIYHQQPRAKRREAALAALERVGMDHRLEHEARLLSGGEQQRVAMARALVTTPDLLLADEPTGAVDSENGAKILDLLLDLNREGRTLVLVTHDASIAERAQRSIRLHDGRIVD